MSYFSYSYLLSPQIITCPHSWDLFTVLCRPFGLTASISQCLTLVVSAPESGTVSRISHRLRTASGQLGVRGFPRYGEAQVTGFTPGAAALKSTGNHLPATTGSISCQLVSFSYTLCSSATTSRDLLHESSSHTVRSLWSWTAPTVIYSTSSMSIEHR